MSIENETVNVQAATRTLQIIVGALTLGVVWFLVIVLVFLDSPSKPPGNGPAAPKSPFITYVALAFGTSLLIGSFIAPKLVVDAGLRGLVKSGASAPTTTDDAGGKQVKPAVAANQLLPLYHTQLIIGAAMVEGGAFFAIVAYLLEDQYLALGVAAALLAVLISRFPTVDGVGVWLDEKLNRLNEMRNAEW